MARLAEKYQKEMIPALMEEFKYKSVMAVPKLVKMVLNIGLGEAIREAKLLDVAAEELAAITGQKPIIRNARKAIAAFKLRQGMPIGVMVTLRGERLYEFFDRLVNIALPRVRDFRGLSPRAFDGKGNYTLGIKDQFIFPEMDLGENGKDTGNEYYDRDQCPGGSRGTFFAGWDGHAFCPGRGTGCPNVLTKKE